MNTRDIIACGIPNVSRILDAAKHAAKAARLKKGPLRAALKALGAAPENYAQDPVFGELAQAILQARSARELYRERAVPAAYARWGQDLDPAALVQMEQACRLPISVAGALLPDAHVGYGLPIGGVLATTNAVIPYAVGVDIACRMKLTVLDLPISALVEQQDRLVAALEAETRFGVGATFSNKRRHAIMDEDWNVAPILARLKDKAWAARHQRQRQPLCGIRRAHARGRRSRARGRRLPGALEPQRQPRRR